MITVFDMLLEARDDARGLARAYGLAAGRDLFGTWIVEVRHGRIGTRGRVRHLALETELAARAEILRRLKRRASSPKRIGAVYQVTGVAGCDWLEWGGA